MSETSDDPRADDHAKTAHAIEALAGVLGIAVDPAWRDSVAQHFEKNAEMASLLLEFPLEEEVQSEPAFRL